MVPALMSRVRNVTGRNVSVAALFQNPTVQGLAAYLTIEPGSGQKLADKSLARADQARSALRRAGRHRGRAGRRDE